MVVIRQRAKENVMKRFGRIVGAAVDEIGWSIGSVIALYFLVWFAASDMWTLAIHTGQVVLATLE